MKDYIEKGSLVEIEQTILKASQRAKHLPEESRRCDLKMRVKGYLEHPALPGEKCTIRSAIGRLLEGELCEPHPAYHHSFGEPIPELLAVGLELRSRLKRGENND